MPLLRLGDLLLVVFLCALFFVLLQCNHHTQSSSTFEFFCNDSLIFSDTLHQQRYTIQTVHGPVELLATDSSVQILSSSCPEKICEHSLPIKKSGQEIICVPNRYVLRMSGKRSSDVDIIAR